MTQEDGQIAGLDVVPGVLQEPPAVPPDPDSHLEGIPNDGRQGDQAPDTWFYCVYWARREFVR